ncbi:MAG: hypothetical protein JSU87_12930 [Gemmatimonadota bacterium]|nr:MAG: hypothetical protein JSU87_12930 [Gemmatimonadota bacterium]
MLGRDIGLDYRTVIPVLGIPVTFETNAPEIMSAVEESFGLWHSLAEEPGRAPRAEPRVRLIMQDGAESASSRIPISYRLPDPDRVILRTSGSFGVADCRRRDSVAYITPALVDDRDNFRYGFLEALTMFVLTQLDRQPLHAAALVRGATALLISGPSGVGKSSLTYAGMRAGLKVLAEDIVYLQTDPKLRVWGVPGYLYLPAHAGAHFPELDGREPTLRANGKLKIAIDIRDGASTAALSPLERIGTCVLSRAADGPRVTRLPPNEVEAAMTANVEVGFDIFEESIGAVIREIARMGGGWRLELAGHPSDAVPFLLHMLDELDAG